MQKEIVGLVVVVEVSCGGDSGGSREVWECIIKNNNGKELKKRNCRK